METDEQFVERVAASKSGGSDRVLVLHDEADIDRLLALALRGAKVQWVEAEKICRALEGPMMAQGIVNVFIPFAPPETDAPAQDKT